MLTSLQGRIVVFAGPSMPSQRRPADPRLVWRGPAMAGDVLWLSGRGPAAVVLVDGVFDEVPSVRHKELLVLMGEGVRVMGGASMGALRAAELQAFGMIGIGRVFAAYARGSLTGDDEVALAHAPEQLDWRPLSEALVNVRATLQRAMRRRVIDAATARALFLAAQGLFFRERTWPLVLDSLKRGGLSLATFERWLPAGRVDVKAEDALACVQAALDLGPVADGGRTAPPATLFTAALAKQIGWRPASAGQGRAAAEAPAHLRAGGSGLPPA